MNHCLVLWRLFRSMRLGRNEPCTIREYNRYDDKSRSTMECGPSVFGSLDYYDSQEEFVIPEKGPESCGKRTQLSVPKYFGPFSPVIIPSKSQERGNFISLCFLLSWKQVKRPVYENSVRQFRTWLFGSKMLSGQFGKRAPQPACPQRKLTVFIYITRSHHTEYKKTKGLGVGWSGE